MDALDRFAQLMEQHPPPDRQAAADSDAHFRARVSWMLGLYDQFEAEGLRLQEARETFEEGERQVVVARTLRTRSTTGSSCTAVTPPPPTDCCKT